jgi:hypothetical protein
MEQDGRQVLWTSGLTAGFTARIHRFPQEDVTLVYLSNIFTPASRPILRDLAAMSFGGDPKPPVVWRPITLTPSARSAFAGAWGCDTGFDGFEVEDRQGRLTLTVDGKPFLVVPRADNRLWLPTDYAMLDFGNRGPAGFTEIHYDGGFDAVCRRRQVEAR